MKLFICVLLLAVGSYATAMRCNQNIIARGDSMEYLIQQCGEPSSNGVMGSTVYLNKDGTGMNYYIDIDSNGRIGDIQYSRGGLR